MKGVSTIYRRGCCHFGRLREWRAGLLLTFAASVLLSGCGTHLYNKTREDQAAAAKTSWQAVDLKAVFNKERDRQVFLLNQEQDNQVRLGAIDHDANLWLMAAEPLNETLVLWVRVDIRQIVGPSGADAFESWAEGKSHSIVADCIHNQTRSAHEKRLGGT